MSPERKLRDAVTWHVRLGSPDAGEAEFAEFAAWLESDPQNRVLFDRVEDFDRRLADAIVEQPQTDSSESWRALRQQSRAPSRIRLSKWVSGAAAMAAILLILFTLGTRAPPAVHYATAVGQSRTVRLSDGSKVEMNTATSMSVQMGSEKRYVILDRGEAIFQIRPDRDRPFVVAVGDRQVRDVGTVFDILRSSGEITVAVAEGQVAVGPISDAEPIILGAGDRIRHTEGTNSSKRDRIDPKLVTAWRSGYMVYRNVPLGEVIDDLNRYFRLPIIVEPGELFLLRFSGVLHIRDEAAAIAQLTGFLPIVAVRASDGSIRLRAAERKH
ncbi:MAG: FecR domain-containing protein [Alphaproteobacteria bacterium]|nr:FecR domain-containing protein [Alphaproteobacteria bacterium]